METRIVVTVRNKDGESEEIRSTWNTDRMDVITTDLTNWILPQLLVKSPRDEARIATRSYQEWIDSQNTVH